MKHIRQDCGPMGGPLSTSRQFRNARTILGVLALVGMVLLSGCAAKKPMAAAVGPQASGPAQYDENTGGIEGMVLSDEQLPLAGASVGIPDLGITAQTDTGGHYSLSNVAPGPRTLHAALLGYGSEAIQVEVVAGEVKTGADFSLAASVVPGAASRIFETQRGMFGCGVSARGMLAGSAGLNACAAFNVLDEESEYNANVLYWNLDRDTSEMSGIVFEMTWSSTQTLGRSLMVSLEDASCNDAAGNEGTFASVEGTSPIRIYLTREQVQKVLGDGKDKDCVPFGEKDPVERQCIGASTTCRVMTRVFGSSGTAGPASPADAGATVQQGFTHYITAFYGEPPADVETYSQLNG
jgi:carboxypeptidase family protein